MDEVTRIPFEGTSDATKSASSEMKMKALTGVENKHFPALSEWIYGRLAHYSRLSEEVEHS